MIDVVISMSVTDGNEISTTSTMSTNKKTKRQSAIEKKKATNTALIAALKKKVNAKVRADRKGNKDTGTESLYAASCLTFIDQIFGCTLHD